MSKKKKVLFLVDVEGIAKKGEIKEISESFLSNFLLPKQKVVIYNKNVSKRLQDEKLKISRQDAFREEREKEIFTIIEQSKLTFLLKEKNGKVFGSITAPAIVKVLREKFSLQINKNSLLSFSQLREKGIFFIKVKVGKNLIAKLQIIVDIFQENKKLTDNEK